MRRVTPRPLVALLLVAASLPAAPSGASAQEAGLKGAEIRRLVTGRSANWVTGDGRYSGTITYRPDGAIDATASVLGAQMPVAGTWRIEGDRFCRTMRLDPTPTRCQRVVRAPGEGGQVYRFLDEDGSVATVTTFR